MIATTITAVLGPVGGDLAQVLLVTSLFAALLSFHNVLLRYLFALGNAGTMPAALGRPASTPPRSRPAWAPRSTSTCSPPGWT